MLKIYIWHVPLPVFIVELAMWNWPFVAVTNVLLRTVDGNVDRMSHISRNCGIADYVQSSRLARPHVIHIRFRTWFANTVGYAMLLISFPTVMANHVPPLHPPLKRPKLGLHLLWLVSYIFSIQECPVPFLR